MWQMIIPVVGQLLDKILPDTAEAEKAKARLLEMQISGELSQIAAQLDINKEEAKSASLFVAGWRPAVGWVCVLGLAWNFLGYPLAVWFSARYAADFTPPPLVADNLMELVLGMLGLGALRSFEKYKGVAK